MSGRKIAEHWVTVTHERDAWGDVVSSDITFECRGDQESACHNYPDCECDEWFPGADTGEHWHPDVPQPECWLKTWFDVGFEATPYKPADGGDPIEFEHNVPEGSGPIEWEFAEGIYWHWAVA